MEVSAIVSALASFGDWITNNKELIGAVIAVMGGVSIFLEPIKKFLRAGNTAISDHIKLLKHVPFVKRIQTVDILHYLVALIPAGVHYLQGSHSQNPVIVLGQAFVILGGNKFIYPMFVKPVYALLYDAKAQADVAKAEMKAQSLVADFQG